MSGDEGIFGPELYEFLEELEANNTGSGEQLAPRGACAATQALSRRRGR